MRRIVALLTLSLAALLAPAAQAQSASRLDDILARGVLRVGTTGDYKPFSYRPAKEADFIGLDIELAGELARTMGVKLQLVPTSWPTLMKDFGDDRFDLVIGGVSAEEGRVLDPLPARRQDADHALREPGQVPDAAADQPARRAPGREPRRHQRALREGAGAAGAAHGLPGQRDDLRRDHRRPRRPDDHRRDRGQAAAAAQAAAVRRASGRAVRLLREGDPDAA